MIRFSYSKEEDRDEAAKYLSSYLSSENAQVPIDFLKLAYDINIITMANMLGAQDEFIHRQMPHICTYLDDLGINHYFTYYRFCDMVSQDAILNHIMNNAKSGQNIGYRNSAEIWRLKDVIYTNDYARNITNPFNIFFRITLTIYGDNIPDVFVTEMNNKYHMLDDNGLKELIQNKNKILVFSDIQSNYYDMASAIIRMMHKYL